MNPPNEPLPHTCPTLLVSVDFSAASAQASRAAVALADQCDGQILFLHVVASFADESEVTAFWPDFPERRRTNAKARLESWRQTHASGRRASCEILEGKPFEEIVRSSAERGVDLMVLGRSGKAGLIEQLLGSTAERVVRHASCPVLVIDDSEQAALRQGVQVLLPTDFSPTSLEAFPWAAKFSRLFGARVALVNVQPPMGLPGTLDYVRHQEQIDSLRAQADEQLCALRDRHLAADLPVDVQVVEGTPHRAICRLAQRLEAGLIVMAAHGRTGWRRALIGSTAEQVVRLAPCSILVVQADALPAADNTPD